MLAEVAPILQRSLPAGHFGFATLASEQSLIALAKGDAPTSLKLGDQAVTIVEAAIKAGGQGASALHVVLVRRSAIELAAQRPDQAAADASRALSQLQAEAQPGTFSSHIGRAYLALARALKAQGQSDDARAAARSAAEHLQSTLGPDHPDARSARQLAELAPEPK